MIISGFPGIGKSSHQGNGLIDLESSNFWIGEEGRKVRPEGWYESYCNVAVDLADQGYIVFVPTHKAVRMQLKKLGVDYKVIFPDDSLKEPWINRLEERYVFSPSDKNYKAWRAVKDHWEDMQSDLSEESGSLVLKDMDYDLRELVDLCTHK